ncbi:MAG: hypothetical protein GY953_18290, partial [bacterium]|nr:hypothetical protein [bacterium]
GLTRGEDGASGVPNLGYLTGTITVQRALEVFQEITPFRHLVSLNTGDISRSIPGLRDRLNETMRRFQSDWTAIQVEASADEVLAALPAEADAVLVYPLLRLRPGEFDRLVAGLIERQLPSFAMFLSTEYVGQGILAGLSEDPLPRRARRVALNLQRILFGEDPGTFPVDFPERESLVINMATARAINTYPSFALLTVAELVNEERRDIDRQVDLRAAVEEAVERNLDLAAADRDV